MREGEAEDRTTQAELRDLHHRIDSLKEENERQFNSLTDKLHALEVTLAKGTRFPAAGYVAAVGLALTVVGTGAVLYSELQVSKTDSAKALTLIEEHLKAAPTHRYNVERIGLQVDEWRETIPLLTERMKGLEGRIVGQGPEGWHRKDHDLYAKMMDERNERIKLRLDVIEHKQEDICVRVRSCK